MPCKSHRSQSQDGVQGRNSVGDHLLEVTSVRREPGLDCSSGAALSVMAVGQHSADGGIGGTVVRLVERPPSALGLLVECKSSDEHRLVNTVD
jgi:hypothetical protein